MQALLLDYPNLTVMAGAVEDLILEEVKVSGDVTARVAGIVTGDGAEIRAGRVILTTGTFLSGIIHMGEKQTAGGRIGEAPSLGLSKTLRRRGFGVGRLKTGTPARLDGRTIDWASLEAQPGDNPPVPFSFLTESITTPQINCHITHTNAATHAIILANLHRAPMYSGQIESSVAKSGMALVRSLVITANARSLPVRICGSALNVAGNATSTSPPNSAPIAGATPLNGTCVKRMPAACENMMPARWLVVPVPFDA